MGNKSNNKMKLTVAKATICIYLVALTSWMTTEAHDDPVMKESLNAHNKVRQEETRNLQPVCWNETLACYAQDYANKRKCDCKLEHSNVANPDLCYGENLAMCTADMTITTAVEMWYAEKADYSYETGTCTPGKMCGHYTQIVWKDSTQIGCANVTCDNGGTFITCNYWPPGNCVGEKPY